MTKCRRESVDFIERAPRRIVADVEIDATADRVFAALADTPRWPEWFSTLKEAAWTSDAHGGVGATRSVKLGPIRVDEEFIVWEPGARWGFTFTASKPTFAAAGVELVELTPTPAGGTHLRYTMAVEPAGVVGRLVFARPATVRSGLERGLAGLEPYLRANG